MINPSLLKGPLGGLLLLALAQNPGCTCRRDRGQPQEEASPIREAEPGSPVSLEALGAPSPIYGPPSMPVESVELAQAAVALVNEAFAEEGQGRAQVDLAACRAAAEMARLMPLLGEMPPEGLGEFLLSWAGSPATSPGVLYLRTSSKDPQEYLDHLPRALAVRGSSREFNLVGVGRVEQKGFVAYVTLLLDLPLTLSPLPRRTNRGDTQPLSFRLHPHLSNPTVLALPPEGHVQTLSTRPLGGHWYEASWGPLEDPGEHMVEILAEGPRGPEVLAQFPLYCEVDLPRRYTSVVPPDESDLASPREAEEAMFVLLNQDRAAHGLSPLQRRGDLDAVARAHSQDMEANSFMAHVSPTTGTPSDRFRRAGLKLPTMAENVAMNNTVYGAQASLMKSLGHRMNILSDRFTLVGIGAALRQRPDGSRVWLLSQEFARPVRRVDPREVAREAILRINRQRRERGWAGLEEDGDLSLVAGLGAEEVIREGTMKGNAPTRAMERAIRERRVPYATMRSLLQLVLEPLDLDLSQATNDREAQAIGVGVFQGAYGKEGLLYTAVVILLVSR